MYMNGRNTVVSEVVKCEICCIHYKLYICLHDIYDLTSYNSNDFFTVV